MFLSPPAWLQQGSQLLVTQPRCPVPRRNPDNHYHVERTLEGMSRLGRFGKIKITGATAPSRYGHNGHNGAAGWWVRDGSYHFAGVACQEDHQFHENWKWGLWPFFFGLAGFGAAVSLFAPWWLCAMFLIVSLWGIGNVTFLPDRGRREAVGQVIECLVAVEHYGADLEEELDIAGAQLGRPNSGYRGKGMFKGMTQEEVRQLCASLVPEAHRWLAPRDHLVLKYLKADKFLTNYSQG